MLPPLRAKYPDAIIDIHTSTMYGSAFDNIPFVNNVFKHPSKDKNSSLDLTRTLRDPISKKYDLVYAPHPMFNPGSWTSTRFGRLGTNLICAWIRALEQTDIPFELPLETVLRLTKEEIQKVEKFCKKVKGFDSGRNILMEIHGESGQTFWGPQWTVDVGKYLLDREDTKLFISHKTVRGDIHKLLSHAPNRVYFVGSLTLRECAELFNRCQMFLSVSSGLSNVCNTNWCKNDITWVEVVNSKVVTSAPIRSEGKIFWYENKLQKFLEMLKDRGI
jgi:ADP-heptose:LPS heptosyltransferase